MDQALEAPETRAYRARNFGGVDLRLRFQIVTWGADETNWMGDRLGSGLAYTCIGANAGCSARQHTRRRPADRRAPRGPERQFSRRFDRDEGAGTRSGRAPDCRADAGCRRT